MTAVPIIQNEGPTVAELIEGKGIRTVAIIDDVFDIVDIDALAHMVSNFWELVADTPDALAELHTIVGEGKSLAAEADINSEVIWLLARKQSTLHHLAVAFEPIWDVLGPDIFQIAQFIEHLSEETRVDCRFFGPGDDIGTANRDSTFDVVFLDLVLEPEGRTVNESGVIDGPRGEMAVELARDIYSRANDNHKPLIVLMSNQSVEPSEQEDFCVRSQLLAGLFSFARKDDLVDKHRFLMRMAALVSGIESGHVIQKFVTALANAVNVAVPDFIANVRRLTLEDYAYIQRLRLSDDGHPLGDYMLWLYSSHFGSMVFETATVKQAEAAVDRMKFSGLPPAHLLPSRSLGDMYRSCLFELNVRPDVTNPQSNNPLVELGDVFINDGGSRVWMVISASCDLTYGQTASRPFNGEQSVLIIPGDLMPIASQIAEHRKKYKRTEPFRFRDADFRIEWDVNGVIVVPYGRIFPWVGHSSLVRVARLRETYALDVQREFASALTRVGHPVSPPDYRPVTLSLVSKGNNNHDFVDIIGERSDVAAISPSGEKDYKECVVIRVDYLVHVAKECYLRQSAVIEQLQADRSRLAAAHRGVSDIDNKIEAAMKVLSDDRVFSNLLTPPRYPAVQKEEVIVKGLLSVCRQTFLETGSPKCELVLKVVDA